MRRATSLILCCILLILMVVQGCTEEEETPSGNDFSFTTLSGDTRQLSDYAGTVILLDCMAVNCEPCLYQLLELKKVSENYSTHDVTILSIDVWVSLGETASMLHNLINAFQDQMNITFDWTFGLDDNQGTIQNTYAASGVPSLYIFDKKGNIYYSHVGYEAYESISSKLDEVL